MQVSHVFKAKSFLFIRTRIENFKEYTEFCKAEKKKSHFYF